MRAATIAVLAALPLAGAAVARSVDYLPGDASLLAAATELKISPVSPLPARGTDDIALVVAPAADHETLALGMYCSAFRVTNPVSALLPRLAAAWDGDGVLASDGKRATVTLRIGSARSYRRCVELTEANTRCITRVAMAGTLEAEGQSIPVAGEAERDASVGGFCGNLARGIGVVSREAGLALIADVRAKLETARRH